MISKIQKFVIVIICASLSGCGTFFGWGVLGPRPYHGVQTDALIIRGEGDPTPYAATNPTPLLRVLCILDLPLSITADTILLPYTIVCGK